MLDTDATDAALLEAVPEFISFGTLAKATPSEDGGRRLIYFEASNEDVDHQGEVILQKALADSADYYLRHGNIDLSHFTILGPKAGIPNHLEYEVGRPIEVRANGRKTFVKAELYSGQGAMARNADLVWASLAQQSPPAAWFASVGGAVLAKGIRLNPLTGERVAVVSRVRWNNTALDRCPVNKTVPTISTLPIGTFAKALGGFVIKSLTAEGGTDSAALEGGAALRQQNLDGSVRTYWDFRERMAGALRRKKVAPGAAALVEHASAEFGLTKARSAEWTERFMADVAADLKKRAA